MPVLEQLVGSSLLTVLTLIKVLAWLLQLGSVADVRLSDITAVSENGIIIAGSPGSLINGLTLQVLHYAGCLWCACVRNPACTTAHA